MARLAALLVSFTALTSGCAPSEIKLAAEGQGDLSHAPAPRGAAGAELRTACGDGAPLPGSAAFARSAYVGGTSADATRIRLAASKHQAVPVTLSRADGLAVGVAMAERDRSAVPVTGAPQFEARVANLEPNTTYCYELTGMTAKAGFRTAPSAGSADPVRFLVFGDSGVGTRYQHAVAKQLTTVPFDFVLHTGDVAYPNGTRTQLQRYFFEVYPEITRSFPVFPALGNHDARSEGGAPLFEAFPLPGASAPFAGSRYYSFDWGGLHLVALDTEAIDEAQAAWLDADLAAHRGAWLIVFGHRPPYSSGDHGSDHAFRELFVPILEQHAVAVVFSGHEHNYERTQPINGVTYVVTGGGGAETRPVAWDWFTAYAEDVLHFVFVEADAEALVLHAIDGVGKEFDSARIERL